MQLVFHVDVAFAAGILVGLVAANFVPSDKACAIPGKEPSDAESLAGKS